MNISLFKTLQTFLIISLFSIFIILGTIKDGFSETRSCVNRCVYSHSLWGQFECSEGEEYYIIGQKCYEIQNECFQECNLFWNESRNKVYTLPPEKITNQWRQEQACSPILERLPLEILPGDHLIAPDWKGQCECLNGKIFVGKCGHNELSCDQVCDSGSAF